MIMIMIMIISDKIISNGIVVKYLININNNINNMIK